jgi:hypothetical protein
VHCPASSDLRLIGSNSNSVCVELIIDAIAANGEAADLESIYAYIKEVHNHYRRAWPTFTNELVIKLTFSVSSLCRDGKA